MGEPHEHLPRGLKRSPIVEAICEVRFDVRAEAIQAASALLTADFFRRFTDGRPSEVHIIGPELPGELPAGVPEAQAEALRYRPSRRLVWASGTAEVPTQLVQLGRTVASLHLYPPYPGWEVFKSRIDTFLRLVEGNEVVSVIKQCGLRYVNILPAFDGPSSSLNMLEARIALKGIDIRDQAFQLRSEDVFADGRVQIVTIAQPAQASVGPTAQHSGLLVDVDTQTKFGNEAQAPVGLSEEIEALHDASKRTFFALLKKSTLSALGPIWEGTA